MDDLKEFKVIVNILASAEKNNDRRLVGRLVKRIKPIAEQMQGDEVKACLKEHNPISFVNDLFNVESTATAPATVYSYVWLLACRKFPDFFTVGVVKQMIDHLLSIDNRQLDPILARLVHIFGQKADYNCAIHNDLMQWMRWAQLRHDYDTFACCHTTLSRVYLKTGQWDMMAKLFEKAPFDPKLTSHQSAARHLYYQARLHAVRCNYKQAREACEEAIRKAPSDGCLGFNLDCLRILIVVRLLEGSVPELSLFRGRPQLQPYYLLAKVVRNGDVEAFQKMLVDSPFVGQFQRDGLEGLIVRLHHNVLKAALKRISKVYGRISVSDIARKLGNPEPDDCLLIVAKAIREGVMGSGHLIGDTFCAPDDADDNGNKSKSGISDDQLHARILACQGLSEEIVKAMRYPDRKLLNDSKPVDVVEESIVPFDEDDEDFMDEEFF
mgnify:CR=1 FL=1